jgi:ferritin-like protein
MKRESDSPASSQRRQFVRVVLQAAALPIAYSALEVPSARAAEPRGAKPLTGNDPVHIVRDFQDPYLELLRLLNVAAEIEHGLMVQYLYCAFSIKPRYAALAGYGAPSANDILGIAIQEMQHLGKVNNLLGALGAAPVLIREDFPYEPDIIPFRFRLEPASRASLAKYVWTESPIGATDLAKARTVEDRTFCRQLDQVLSNGQRRPNFVGPLYDALIALVKEVDATKDKSLPDLKPFVPILEAIKAEGEVGHYQTFRKTFLGVHPGFAGAANVWQRPVTDPLYPAYQLPHNPTAYVGHENQIQDPAARRLAWLGNMHYWSLLNLLSTGYSKGSTELVLASRTHMMGPFMSLARQLAKTGSGMPFDPLGQGYGRSASNKGSANYLRHLLAETDRFEKQIGKDLPSDYPVGVCGITEQVLTRVEPQLRAALAPMAIDPWDVGLA